MHARRVGEGRWTCMTFITQMPRPYDLEGARLAAASRWNPAQLRVHRIDSAQLRVYQIRLVYQPPINQD